MMQRILAVLNKYTIYLAVIAALALLFLSRPLVVKTDILALLPPTKENSIRQEAFLHLSSSTMNRITILIGAENAAKSKEAGLYLQSMLNNSGLTTSYEAEDSQKVLIEAFAKHNYQLLSAEELGENTYQKALATLYTPMTMNIAGIERDPFMLLTDYMLDNRFLSTAFSMVDGVPTIENNGKIYSLMTADLDAAVLFSPSKLSPLMQTLYAARADTEARFNADIVLSGVPLHTEAASSSSMKEINIISIISFVIILLISIIVLRSPLGFLVSVCTIAISFAVAFMIVNIAFGEIHIFTLVFGTSLIGLCIDYCLHYFIERSCEQNSQTALSKIIKAISLSLCTSLLGFSTLITSAMPLMRQMALFSICGLLWAYITIVIFYPLIFRRLSLNEPPIGLLQIEKILLRFYRLAFSKKAIPALLVVAVILAIGISKLRTNDGIQHLYRPSAELIAAESRSVAIHKMNFSPAFFFIAGDSSEEILQTESTLVKALQDEVSAGTLEGYKAISTLIPSEKTQAANYKTTTTFFNEYIDEFGAVTGIDTTNMRAYMQAQSGSYLHVEDLLDLKGAEMLKNFWQQGKGSFVLLYGLADRKSLEKYQGGDVYYLDKIGDYDNLLKEYRNKTTIIIAIAFAIIVSIMVWRYRLRLGLLTTLPVTLAILIMLATFGYIGLTLSFFHIIALFLVLCFGIDYTIFQVETKGKLKHSGTAVLLSCITTLASFGLMAFTSFEVTRALGLTLFIGIFLSYIFSFIPKALAR